LSIFQQQNSKKIRPESPESKTKLVFHFQWGSQKLEPKIRIPNQDGFWFQYFCKQLGTFPKGNQSLYFGVFDEIGLDQKAEASSQHACLGV
jgi:hypothetical protein